MASWHRTCWHGMQRRHSIQNLGTLQDRGHVGRRKSTAEESSPFVNANVVSNIGPVTENAREAPAPSTLGAATMATHGLVLVQMHWGSVCFHLVKRTL